MVGINTLLLTPVMVEDRMVGYDIDDIEKSLGPDRFSEFNQWFYGQTGAIVNGKLVVYNHDFARFLAGLDDAEWS